MTKPNYKKILEHPDKDEIISKLIIGRTPKEIHEWLVSKYTNLNEIKFTISEKTIKSFQENYLDMYNMIQEDLIKTKSALANNTEDELKLSVQNVPLYKDLMIQTANEELDIRKIVKNLCIAIETRFAQVFDQIQEHPRNINTRVDRLFKEYAETLANILEKYYKFTEEPAKNVTQHNITLQVVDQHITVFHDVIKEILSQMDLDTSLYFMEVFNEKMNKLKIPEQETGTSSEVRLAEAKLLNETINKKING